jgi:hypothetical protein
MLNHFTDQFSYYIQNKNYKIHILTILIHKMCLYTFFIQNYNFFNKNNNQISFYFIFISFKNNKVENISTFSLNSNKTRLCILIQAQIFVLMQ